MSCDLVIIGASWGGLRAVGEILRGLPEDFPAPVVVIQHRQESAENLLAGLLDRQGPLNVVDAEDKSPLKPGCVHVAPPGYHVLIEPGHIELSVEAQVRHSRPSIDVAFESAAHAYGDGVIGVVLTGANEDGAEGLARIRRRGGIGVVQDPDTAERPRMPAAAIDAADPQYVCPLPEIAPLLVRLADDEKVSR
jgi:two-component system, chemotaxis family, protein-glutamate methylesterase/glutaminase